MKCMPTWCCKDIFSIDLNVLKEHNVKYILTDLDNTLAPFNVPLPTDCVKELVANLKKEGFIVIIVSNNTAKRVENFAKELKVDIISGAKKPFTSTISKYLQKHNIDINDCVLVGDQLMTDIKCANKLGCKCILTTPIANKDALVTFINRKIDMHLRKKYDLVKTCKKIDRSDRR